MTRIMDRVHLHAKLISACDFNRHVFNIAVHDRMRAFTLLSHRQAPAPVIYKSRSKLASRASGIAGQGVLMMHRSVYWILLQRGCRLIPSMVCFAEKVSLPPDQWGDPAGEACVSCHTKTESHSSTRREDIQALRMEPNDRCRVHPGTRYCRATFERVTPPCSRSVSSLIAPVGNR